MATHSSILAWRIPWTEEPGGLQSIVSQRVWYSWQAFTSLLQSVLQNWVLTGERPKRGEEFHNISVQFSSVAQACLTLCDPMNRGMPGLPVHHQLPEFTQTHVHWVGDAIQPSHPLLSPSPPAPNSQYVHVSNITLYTLNLHNVICNYISIKPGKKEIKVLCQHFLLK